MSYEYAFASVYDKFTENAEPEARAAFVLSLLKEAGVPSGILLDLACGTGVMTACYEKAGYDVIGVDLSEEMLDLARARLSPRALLLHQDMLALDLYGTVNACVCSLDSVNHLTDLRQVERAFSRVSLFTEPGGVFVFDVNTVFKHREILSNNAFVYEDETDVLVWQNFYDPADETVVETVDVFSLQKDGSYQRASDEIVERAYELEALRQALEDAGFCQVRFYGDLKKTPPEEKEERVYVFAIKR